MWDKSAHIVSDEIVTLSYSNTCRFLAYNPAANYRKVFIKFS